MSEPSVLLVLAFSLLLTVTILVAIWIAHRWGHLRATTAAAVLVVWLGVSGGIAEAGWLRSWDSLPPPALLLFGVGFLGTLLASRLRFARRIADTAPIALLVGFHAFRLPLELVMHRAHSEGVMPIQMSFSGSNFDILTGMLAVALGLWAWKGSLPRPVLWGFNLIGLGLLITIVTIAIRSMPMIAAFGPDQLNLWVTYVPFVWLPCIFVLFALFGHLLLFRRLLRKPRHQP